MDSVKCSRGKVKLVAWLAVIFVGCSSEHIPPPFDHHIDPIEPLPTTEVESADGIQKGASSTAENEANSGQSESKGAEDDQTRNEEGKEESEDLGGGGEASPTPPTGEEEDDGGKTTLRPPATFTLNPPLAPLNSTPQFTWEASRDAESYQVHFTETDTCDPDQTATATVQKLTWTSSAKAAGNYYFCVFAINKAGKTPASNQNIPVTIRKGWYPIATLGAPSARRAFTAAMVDGKVLIYGGSAGADPLDTGALYDPAKDQWITLATANTGVGAVGWHTITAISENKAILWGGWPTNRTAYGYLYDHKNQTIATIKGTGQPAARFSHTSVWSGKELLIFGGDTDSNDGYQGTASGFRYDPADDIWVPFTAGAEIDPRIYHHAVWTGKQMLIWGGAHSMPDEIVGTGGRFDPATGTWSPISDEGAPSPRVLGSAVWTGTEMIIFGGQRTSSNESVVASGARYNPQTDSWTPLDTANGPSARSGHGATWTGQALFIFGGLSNFQDLNDGYLFYP